MGGNKREEARSCSCQAKSRLEFERGEKPEQGREHDDDREDDQDGRRTASRARLVFVGRGKRRENVRRRLCLRRLLPIFDSGLGFGRRRLRLLSGSRRFDRHFSLGNRPAAVEHGFLISTPLGLRTAARVDQSCFGEAFILRRSFGAFVRWGGIDGRTFCYIFKARGRLVSHRSLRLCRRLSQ